MGVLTDNMRGALLMTICMVAFTVNDAFMKTVLGDVPLFQALFLRGVVTSALLLAMGMMMRALTIPRRPRDRWLIALRTLAELVAALLFMTALGQMPLANVSAILQVLPLTVTLASAMIFAEPLGWRRLTAIAVGFCGVLLIVRPGTEGFNVYSLYAIGSVAAVTLRDLAARGLSRDVSSIGVALFAALGVGTVAGAASLFTPWVGMSPRNLGLLGAAAIFVIAGYLCSVMAMRVGEIAFIAPFRYSSLIAALILGLVIFGDWPRPLTLLGAGIVVATGAFTFYREQRLLRTRRRMSAG